MTEITRDDVKRIEDKVDRLADAVNRLVLIEERQSLQGQRIGKVEARIEANEVQINLADRKIDQWVNRGMGVWAFVAAAAAVLTLYLQFHRSVS